MSAAAKNGRSFSDDGPDFGMEIGCMKGIFNLFDRRSLFISRRVAGPRKLLPCPDHARIGETCRNAEVVSTKLLRERERISVGSDRPSSSSSSSAFSSANCSRTTDSEPSLSSRTTLLSDVKKSLVRRQSVDFHDAVKESISKDSAAAAQRHAMDAPRLAPRFSYDERGSSDTVKVKELPRLSLDSTRPSSVVAKLMGLESCPSINEEDERSRAEKQTRANSPRTPRKDSTSPRLTYHSSSSSSSSSVYAEMEKRLSELEFQKSGKDLRALQQILETIQNKNPNSDHRSRSPITTAPPPSTVTSQFQRSNSDRSPRLANREKLRTSMKETGSPSNRIVIMKPAPPAPSCSSSLVLPLSVVDGGTWPAQARKEPFLKSRLKELNRNSDSPHRKPLKLEKRLPNVVITSESASRRTYRTSDRPVKNVGPQNSVGDRGRRLTPRQNETSRKSPATLRRDTTVMQEQPSPVSVLDAFCRDDSPSPVKKTPNIFTNDFETSDCDDGDSFSSGFWHRRRLHLGFRSSTAAGDGDGDLISPNADPDHVYISEILRASGLLSNPFVVVNPSLFFLVEGDRVARKTATKVHRKLIFDAVAEVQSSRLSRVLLRSAEMTPSGEQALKEVCSEIDELQSACGIRVGIDRDNYDENEDGKLSEAVLRKDTRNWNGFRHGIFDLVLCIEQLIFKDLVSELVIGS